MVDLTAKGSGYFRVYVDDVEVSQHLQEREAAERVVELKALNPDNKVVYRHDGYEVEATDDSPVLYLPKDVPVALSLAADPRLKIEGTITVTALEDVGSVVLQLVKV